jgi:hypothetical protein
MKMKPLKLKAWAIICNGQILTGSANYPFMFTSRANAAEHRSNKHINGEIRAFNVTISEVKK